MKTDIIDPLLGEKALVSFHGDLNEVDSMVSRGLLTNPREVEARLISNGRVNKLCQFAREKRLIRSSSMRLLGKPTKDTWKLS